MWERIFWHTAQSKVKLIDTLHYVTVYHMYACMWTHAWHLFFHRCNMRIQSESESHWYSLILILQSEICVRLLENCNFLSLTFLTHNTAVYLHENTSMTTDTHKLHFYHAMLCILRLCHSKSSVCPSVRLWHWGMIFTQVGILRK